MNHLIAGICSVDKSLPLEAWDFLQLQAELHQHTLPTHQRGRFSTGTTISLVLLSLLRVRVLAFGDPEIRPSFYPHVIEGYYVCPAPRHLRCYNVFIKETKKAQIVGQLSRNQSPPHRFPGSSPADELLKSIITLNQSLFDEQRR